MIAATRRRTSFTSVIALLALVIAVGGSGQAIAAKAKALAKNVVTSKQVKNETLTSVDIKNGTLTAADVKDGSLSATDLASGVIPAAPTSLPPSGTAGGDLTGSFPNPTLSAATRASFQEDYAKTIVVSSEGTASGNGDELTAAVAAVADAGQQKRYLIRLEPGVFGLDVPLVLPDNVDLEGSGPASTSIGYVATALDEATVTAGNMSEIRDLNIQVSAFTTEAVALEVPSAADVNLRNVYVQNFSPNLNAVGINILGTVDAHDLFVNVITGDEVATGINVSTTGTLEMAETEILMSPGAAGTATALAVSGTALVDASKLDAGFATAGFLAAKANGAASDVRIRNSVTRGLLTEAGGGFMALAASEISGQGGGSTATCVHAYTAAFVAVLDGNCP